MRIQIALITCFSVVLAAAPSAKESGQTVSTDSATLPSMTTTVDKALKNLIQQYGLTGDPVGDRPIPDIQSPKAQLGMQLFYSRTLSGSLDTACVSCHHPMLGGGDNLSLPIGVKSEQMNVLGQGRQRKHGLPPDIARNAPTTFNIALWQKNLFHDGRIEHIGRNRFTTPDFHYPKIDPLAGTDLVQAQARFPVIADREMRGESFAFRRTKQAIRLSIAARLAGNAPRLSALPRPVTDYWLEAFRTTFNAPEASAAELITEQTISALLAEYQRSQVFVNTPWHAYIQGNTQAISDQAKQGALLFYQSKADGGYACNRCHAGDFFSNEQFYAMLIPPIGPGKAGRNGVAVENLDFGRRLVTRDAADNYKFRVPSLLNVEVTGPWGHNGAYTSLSAIVRHMIAPKHMLSQYDPKQLTQKNIPMGRLHVSIDALLKQPAAVRDSEASAEDIQALVAFLKTLTDPCVTNRECLSPWIPDNEAKRADPLLLKAVDSRGKLL